MSQQSPAEIPPEVMARVQRLRELLGLMNGVWVPQAIYAAVELGIPDVLAGGPKQSDDVAKAVSAHPGAVRRLLRALATLGLCTQTEAGAFELAPLGAPLRSDAPDSMRNWVLLIGRPKSFRAWAEFVDCVRTGQHVAKLREGIDDAFQTFTEPGERAVFDQSMAEGTKQVAGAVALAYDFSGVKSIVDVGGGYGALFPPILRAHPEMTGVIFDQPHCREGAERVFQKTRIAERCQFVGGSFFEDALPAGADVYLLKSIIHDWNDERSLAILRRCRTAMRDDSRLLVIEIVVPDRLEPTPENRGIAFTDLNMLVSTGGLERTEAEYGTLLEAAGLRVWRIVPTLAGLSVIDARPR